MSSFLDNEGTLEYPFPLDGVRLSTFTDFVYTCGKGSLEGLTTADVNVKFLKTMTKASECSYCDLVCDICPENVGRANVFISHAWKYKFTNLVSALDYHFRDKPNIYIWFDLFSVNQHITEKVDPDWWNKSFMNAVREIGYVVVVLSPWKEPIPFTRAWCLWEIYCAIMTGSKLEVAMDNDEREDFVYNLNDDPSRYMQLLADIDVAKSEAWKIEDRDQIFAAVESMDGGFSKVNSMVCSRMRALVKAIIKDSIDESMKHGLSQYLIDSRMTYADILLDDGDYEGSLDMYRMCLEGYITLFDETDLNVARAYNGMAVVYDEQGEYEEALVNYEKSLVIRKDKLGQNHSKVGDLYTNIGAAYYRLDEYDKVSDEIYYVKNSSIIILCDSM
jgi:hypothetical protein